VLTNTAERLYALQEPTRAATVAQRILELNPPAPVDMRRTAWTVIAHTEFDRGAYDRAENAYQQVLVLTDAKAPTRAALTERLAASVYKQGEQARKDNRQREAVGHFQRVAQVAPTSAIRATADYDAAASLIVLKDWTTAALSLEAFRRNYPKTALQAEVPGKLAVCYLESGQPLKAASEFEAMAGGGKDAKFSSGALWQAAELYEKAGYEKNATAAYERYVKQYPDPLAPALPDPAFPNYVGGPLPHGLRLGMPFVFRCGRLMVLVLDSRGERDVFRKDYPILGQRQWTFIDDVYAHLPADVDALAVVTATPVASQDPDGQTQRLMGKRTDDIEAFKRGDEKEIFSPKSSDSKVELVKSIISTKIVNRTGLQPNFGDFQISNLDEARDQWSHRYARREQKDLLTKTFKARFTNRTSASGRGVLFLSGDIHIGCIFDISTMLPPTKCVC
jgi:tetratricopeptide (TPR) repeat protein